MNYWLLAAFLMAGESPSELTLERCKALARQYHPRLTAASNQIEVAEARVGQSWANSLPMVDVIGSYLRSTSNFARIPGQLPESFLTNSALAGTESDRSFNHIAGVVAARHTLYDFGRTSGAIEANQRTVAAADAVLKQVMSDLAFELTQAYWQYLSTVQIVKVREEAVGQMSEYLEKAKSQFEAGKRPKTDATKAEVDLANAKLALIQSRADQRVYWVGLQQAMGFPGETLSSSVAKREEPVVAETMGVTEAVTEATERRQEVSALRKQILSAEAWEAVAQSGFFPSLSAQAQYEWRGQEMPLTHNWFLGMSITFPVFSGFMSTYKLEEARASTKALKAQLQTLLQVIRVEVEQALASLETMAERVRAAEVVVEHATEHLTLVRSRYEAGAGSSDEWSQGQTAFHAAEIQRIQALTDYAIAKARWQRATGRLSL